MKNLFCFMLLVVSVLLFSCVAFATYKPPTQNQGQGQEQGQGQAQGQAQLQGQAQGQAMVQGQNQGISGSGNSTNSGNAAATGGTVANSGNSELSIKDSFNEHRPIRDLPIASDVKYGIPAQYYARPEPDKGENFISARAMIELMNTWTVEEMSDSDIDRGDIQIDITQIATPTVEIDRDGNKSVVDRVMFHTQGSESQLAMKRAGSRPFAIGTIKCDDEDINSAELFMVLVETAQKLNARNIILIGEGVKLSLRSSGWGIGLSYNYATVGSDPSDSGSVGAGGTGYSRGTASYRKMPYLTFAFAD